MSSFSPRIPREISLCLLAAAEGTLTAEEARTLEQWVQADPAHIQIYVTYLDLHDELLLSGATSSLDPVSAAQLPARHSDEALLRIMTQIVEGTPAPATEGGASEPQRSQAASAATRRPTSGGPQWWRRMKHTPYAVTLACSLLAVAAAVAILVQQYSPVKVPLAEKPQQAPADRRVAARVTRMHETVWGYNSQVNLDAPQLFCGSTLDLQRGLVHLQFADGTTAIVEGPTRLTINDNRQPDLQFGKLTAHVPPSAVGFTVQTPLANVVDLGTEFGLLVDDEGSLEVHVFTGKVATVLRNDNGAPASPPHELLAGSAVRFDAPTRQFETRQVLPEAFVLEMPSTGTVDASVAEEAPGSEAGPLVLYECFREDAHAAGGLGWRGGWQRVQGKLPLAAESLTYQDNFGNLLKTQGGSLAQPQAVYAYHRQIDCRPGSAAAIAGLVDGETGKLGRPGTALWLSFLGKGYTTAVDANPYALLGFFEENMSNQRWSIGKVGTSPDWFAGQGGSVGVPFTSPVLIVARVDFSGAQARVRVWVNCRLDEDPSATTPPAISYIRPSFRFDRISIMGNQRFDLDELRFGTSFSGVAPRVNMERPSAAESAAP